MSRYASSAISWFSSVLIDGVLTHIIFQFEMHVDCGLGTLAINAM